LTSKLLVLSLQLDILHSVSTLGSANGRFKYYCFFVSLTLNVKHQNNYICHHIKTTYNSEEGRERWTKGGTNYVSHSALGMPTNSTITCFR